MSKIKAKGVVLKYGDTASPTTTITQTAEVTFDNGNWDRAETTTHDSSGGTKTYVTTLKEPSSVDVRVLLDPADTAHGWLIAAADSGAEKYLTMILPDAGAAQWAMIGHVTTLKTGALTPGGLIEASFTFASDQAHTFTP
jgi:hypothetical protein